MAIQNQETENNINGEESFDIKKFISTVMSHWYLFLLSVIVCIALAFLYVRYSQPNYKINSKITINDDQSSSMLGGKASSSSLMDFSDLLDLSSNAYNEIDILKTNALMTQVVKALHLNVTIYKKGWFKSNELYDESPFDVRVVEKHDSIEARSYNIEIKNNLIHLTNRKYNVDLNVKFGQKVPFEEYDLIFSAKPSNPVNPDGYKLSITSVDDKVSSLSKHFDVDLTDKKSTTLALSFEYPNSKKGEAIIQKLMELYLQSNLQSKKEIADSTLKFIKGRLDNVGAELSGVENKFTQFKQQNQLADVDEQSKALVENVSDYYNKLNELQMQYTLLADVGKYINNPANKRLIPNSLSVQDPIFLGAIAKYDDILVQRDQLGLSYKDDNPVMKNLDENLEAARVSLVSSFNTYKKLLLTSINDLKSRNSSLSEEVQGVPKKQRTYLDYAREQDLKQQLYLYLLQKKEETAISETSTVSSARIIDPAKADYLPFQPNKALGYAMGLILGLLIPWGYLYGREALNIKIINKEDIEQNSKIPILGEIGNNPETKALVVEGNSRSILSEQFRGLRTNLQFVMKPSGCNVLMVTSSMSGEGKSFITMNLGSVLAISGKKVLLMELDLRRPQLSSNLGLDNSNGFTNYIISENMDIDSVVKPAGFSENCFIISSGPIAPNPSELLLKERVAVMINTLKEKFDYIIIDSAPIGLVADAQLIEKHADLSLYIIRQEYTFKTQLNIINNLINEGKFKKAYLVVNDIKSKKAGYYGYGYGYSYGYGYGHNYGGYVDDAKPKSNWLSKRKKV